MKRAIVSPQPAATVRYRDADYGFHAVTWPVPTLRYIVDKRGPA